MLQSKPVFEGAETDVAVMAKGADDRAIEVATVGDIV